MLLPGQPARRKAVSVGPLLSMPGFLLRRSDTATLSQPRRTRDGLRAEHPRDQQYSPFRQATWAAAHTDYEGWSLFPRPHATSRHVSSRRHTHWYSLPSPSQARGQRRDTAARPFTMARGAETQTSQPAARSLRHCLRARPEVSGERCRKANSPSSSAPLRPAIATVWTRRGPEVRRCKLTF